MSIKYIIIQLAIVTTAILKATPSGDAIKAAEKLADLIGIKDQMKASFDAMLPLINQQATQLKLSDNEKTALITIYRDWFHIDMDLDKLYKETIVLYAKAFTIDEINQLIEFYKTPVGKKTLIKLPFLMQEGVKLGQLEAQKKQQALLDRLKPFLEKHKPSK